ncbi:MAG: hypothetical protein Q8830_03370, partial [Candidatus Phytoplasma australasiaticum]|nr:hypothetical protein [Candidatus Phytoplasma australasiaticum]
EKIWADKNVSYKHLRVFGCKAFIHVPKDERQKLDVKTWQYVFIGYGQDEFGYRFYGPVHKKLIRSRDAVFIEDQTIKDINKADKEGFTPKDDSTSLRLNSLTEVPTQVEDEVHDDHPQDTDHECIPQEDEPKEENVDGSHTQPPITGESPVPLRRCSRNV